MIAVGRIEPRVAEKVLRAGEADFIAMGRKLLADPELPLKLKQDRFADIRPCIYCYTCVSEIFHSRQVICALNAETGHEREAAITPAARCRNILVVGGGPAGMEAARVAALRGHQVTLCESSNRLGGTVFFSSIAYQPNEHLITYLARQVQDLPIDIQLGVRVDEALVAQLQPDAVVIATGALREAPAIPGTEQSNVFSGDELRALMTGDNSSSVVGKLNLMQRFMMFCGGLLGITRSGEAIRRLSHLWMPVGKRVAIIGGGLVGVELAEFLAQRRREVSVIEEGEKFGVELAIVRRWRVLDELRELGVVMINNTGLKGIEGTSLHLLGAAGEVSIEADTVILASGAQANRSLATSLQASGLETHVAGDCDGVGYIHGAMHDGHRIGRSV